MYIFQVAAILMNVATVATHVPLQTTFAQIQKVIAKKKIRDGVKNSKWKFKMAFAMKGGGS